MTTYNSQSALWEKVHMGEKKVPCLLDVDV